MTTNTFNILSRASELRAAGQPFALATVTLSQRPTSARLGAKAVITPDGALFGWVGGACSQPSVVRHAREALRDGQPRLVRLTPDDEGVMPRGRPEGVISLPMTCHSGGTLEIFIEPFIPEPYLIAFGDSPIAQALTTLGASLGFECHNPTEADSELELTGNRRRSFIVVATMGVDDEAALLRALALEPDYLAVVGSRRRFETLADYLRAHGVDEERIQAIQAPAGLDIAAETPAEIAVSILAEIIQVRAELRRQGEIGVTALDEQTEPPRIAIDPICGMEVDLATARHTLEVDSETLGFCCAGCLEQYQEHMASA
jgi:xanthine dehydrogenase accessory factor